MTIQAFLKVMPSRTNAEDVITYHLEDTSHWELTFGSLHEMKMYVKKNHLSCYRVRQVDFYDEQKVAITIEERQKQERFCIDCEKINYCKEVVNLDQEACKHFKKRR